MNGEPSGCLYDAVVVSAVAVVEIVSADHSARTYFWKIAFDIRVYERLLVIAVDVNKIEVVDGPVCDLLTILTLRFRSVSPPLTCTRRRLSPLHGQKGLNLPTR